MFSGKSHYTYFVNSGVRASFSGMWSVLVLLKVEIPMWVILKNRLHIEDCLEKRGMSQISTLCVFCGSSS